MATQQTEQRYTWNYRGQNTFGSYLKRKRLERRSSRHSLAVISGIQERRLQALELNQAAPSYGDIKNLAIVLGISESDLLEAAGCVKGEHEG